MSGLTIAVLAPLGIIAAGFAGSWILYQVIQWYLKKEDDE